MDIKISIIIPVYNVASYLEDCLFSCINQTFRDIEIIVVNDGATDESPQIIEKYASADERIVVVNKKNEGLIYARKSGLDIARGEYVFHLDGDDYLENDAMELLYKEALKRNSDCVMAGFFRIQGDKKQEYRWDRQMESLSKQKLLAFIIDMGIWPIWGKLIRKSLFDGVVYRNIFIGEDLYFNMQIVLQMKDFVILDNCLYNYVWNKNSVTGKIDEKTFYLRIEMQEAIWSLLDLYPYEQRIRKQIYGLFLPDLLEAIKDNTDSTEIKRVLRFYYWSNEEVRAILWKDKKLFYFLCGGYICAPYLTSIVARFGYKIKALIRTINK
ncbi:glycosyltransferase family 2 protein [uncultured Parabacteroides sp.]|uniref:glycosyltransferase family 2 protein n=1 Tax=uncultured Parabacteroides sp. TaxID=512312 RepID=UPI0025D47EE6|nr:glycosyltransferase family 2 protein [uncultured Parabacteroides sp.]